VININKTYYYGRVSSQDQNESRQIKAFKDFGCEDEKDIFIDKKSGKDFEREQYKLLKSLLRKNDVLVIQSIDRLGRNYEMIVNEWKDITKNIGADIVVLDMHLLDTRQKKDLLGTFINDLILGLLSYVAQTEREKIRDRQRQGIDIALANGVKFGRKPKTKWDLLNDNNFLTAYSLWKGKQISIPQFQKMMEVKSRTTIYNWINIFENK
jgi:DNA invertase Pin-like site-specific DNA recombinase